MFFQINWRKMAIDPWISVRIKRIKVELTSPPQQSRKSFCQYFATSETNLLAQEVE